MVTKQDRLLEDNLTSWGQILDRLQNTPAFLAALSTRSYTAQRLAQLQAQHQTAVAAYEQGLARQPGERCWVVFDEAIYRAAPPLVRSSFNSLSAFA